MVFHQLGAVIDKDYRDLGGGFNATWGNTIIDVYLNRVNMVGFTVAACTTFSTLHRSCSLDPVGASVIAALAVSVAGVSGIADAFSWRLTRNDRPSNARARYQVNALGSVVNGVFVAAWATAVSATQSAP